MAWRWPTAMSSLPTIWISAPCWLCRMRLDLASCRCEAKTFCPKTLDQSSSPPCVNTTPHWRRRPGRRRREEIPRSGAAAVGASGVMASKPRFAKDGLHFFVIHAAARKGNERHPPGAGAYVSCWINFRLYEGALELAKFYVRNEGWTIRGVDSHTWINGPKHAPRGTVRYYREAIQHGACFVFHEYGGNEA